MDKYISALVDFVKNNKNYEELLKKAPFNLKTIKTCSYNPNWKMFVYNLFDSDLSNPVVRGCRGTVLEIANNDVKVISAPYTKFFNFNDLKGKDIEDSINWNNAQIQMKVDGILCKTAKVDNKLFFFTNGSFELNAPFEDTLVYNEPETRGATTYGDLLSYALKKVDTSTEIHFNRESGEFYITGGWSENIPEGSTLMFELTSPRNKIICEYKETKLWWHGYRDKEGIEHDPRELSFSLPFETPKLFNAANYDELKEILKTFKGNEQEGVVVVDYSTEGTPRTKIKCDSYLKLKFARDTSCNTALLFKAIINDEYDDLIASIPTLLPKVESIKKEIERFYDWFSKEAKNVKERFQSKRELAEWCKKNVNSSLFKYYMLMFEPDKLEKNLKFLSCKKKGYKEFLELLNECN